MTTMKNFVNDMNNLRKEEGILFAFLTLIVYIPSCIATNALVAVMDTVSNWWDHLTDDDKMICIISLGIMPLVCFTLMLVYRILDAFGIIDLEADAQPRK